MNVAYLRPKQKLPRNQKDKDWGEKNVLYYKGACQPAVDRAEALRMYKLANGELDEQDYMYVTNPIRTSRPELLGYPAKMKNHDIISPNVNLMMGEKARRFFPPIVYAKNTNYQTMAMEREQQLLIQELQKMFVNELKALGVPVEEEKVIQGGLEAIQKRIKNLPDELSADGQMTLEYILDHADVLRYLRKGFYDYICTAHVFSYRDVYKDKVCYDIVSPLNFYYLKSPHLDFVEDGEACRAEHWMSLTEVYDRFQDLGREGGFTKELEEFLEKYSTGQGTGLRDDYYYGATDRMGMQKDLYRKVFGYLPEERYSHGVRVSHINWRSQCKQGKVTRPNPIGESEIFYVSEDYIPTEGEQIEWEWVDETWEGYSIDDRFFLGIAPIPIQRGEYNRPQKAKMLYNGRAYTSRHTIPTSIVKKGESYQKSVNIIKYRAEETLAKNLDKVVLFPLGLIPKKEGWNEEKLMYYVRAFSFLFYDDTRPNIQQVINGIKDLNLSMTEHILKSYELVRMFKMEWDEVCGFSPQRKAQIGPDAPVGSTQAAISTSNVMSEETFLTYEEFERREYTCLLELGKYAYHEGVQAHFVRLDGTKAFLNLHDPKTFAWADFGIFVKNGARELQKLEMLRSQVQAFAQNGVGPGIVSKVIEGDNFAELHKVLDEVDAQMEARFQQEQQTQMQIQASKERMEQRKEQFEYYDADLKSTTDIQVALIEAGMQIAGDMQKAEASGDKDSYTVQQDNLEKNAVSLLQNATKLKDIASKERIAKNHDKTMLKNKVVGEK